LNWSIWWHAQERELRSRTQKKSGLPGKTVRDGQNAPASEGGRYNGKYEGPPVGLTTQRSRDILGELDTLVDIGAFAEKEVIQ
jgi:hypothetical protein